MVPDDAADAGPGDLQAAGPPTRAGREIWPDLKGLDLSTTMRTLHLWTQVVGKVRLMLTPWENHGWHGRSTFRLEALSQVSCR